MYSVLLVDDEPLAIEGLRMFVDWEGHGFRICGMCENGTEALAVAQKLMPDVIVTDIRMPQMDGLELIGQLQGERGVDSTEFVVISAYSEFSFAKRAMQLGVHNFLMKPIIEEDADEVLSRIRIRLDKKRAIQRKVEGNQESSLQALMVQKLKKVLQAVEEVDWKRATQEIDSLFQEKGSQILECSEIFLGSLSVQCSKLIFECGGDPALLIIPNSYLSHQEQTQSEFVQKRIHSYVEQAIRTLQSLRKQRPSTLTEIDRYVSNYYRNPLSIRDVATKFYLNPVYLGKAYQEKFGCSLIDRMHNLRISEACEKLRGTNEPISSIAAQVGYTQYHYFLRHFEQRIGMKPMEYRIAQG